MINGTLMPEFTFRSFRFSVDRGSARGGGAGVAAAFYSFSAAA